MWSDCLLDLGTDFLVGNMVKDCTGFEKKKKNTEEQEERKKGRKKKKKSTCMLLF